MLPAVFTIKLPAKTLWALFPLVHGGGHTTNAVGVISQDDKCNNPEFSGKQKKYELSKFFL